MRDASTQFTGKELQALLSATSDVVVILDRDGRYLRVNDSPLLVAPAEQLLGRRVDELLPPGPAARCIEAVRAAIDEARVKRLHYCLPFPQGDREFDALVHPVDERSALLIARDITAHRRIDAALAARYRATALLGRISTRFVNLPPDRIHRGVDEALAEIGEHFHVDRAYVYGIEDGGRYLGNSHGWRREGVSGGVPCDKRVATAELPWLMERLQRRETICVSDLDELPDAAASDRTVFSARGARGLLLVPVVYSGALQGLVGFDTITAPRTWSLQEREFLAAVGELVASALQRRASEERIFRLAYYDRLTDLPNRQLQRERLDQRVSDSGAFGVVLLDLDDSRLINDVLGHHVGDHVLRQVASRLQAALEPGELLGRWGGDEFLMTVPARDSAEAAARAQVLHDHLSRAMRIEGHEMRLSCCAGSAHFPDDASSADGLIRAAEMALGRARHHGRGRTERYLPALRESAARHNAVLVRLRHALDQGDFRLVYQPQVRIVDGHITGFEALLRLDDPHLGTIAPDEFIPIAERSGLIHGLGEWVIRQVCEDLSAWPGAERPRVALNVSPRQLLDDSLPRCLENTLARHGLPASLLELEITESVLMEPDQVGIEHLHHCRQMGMGVAVDDFGTGYSALGKLKQLPTSVLKIDRSFIQDITHDEDDRAIVRAIIAMARQLQLTTVAEGVENCAQLDFLGEAGCDLCQGYVLSPPVPLAQAQRLWHRPLTPA